MPISEYAIDNILWRVQLGWDPRGERRSPRSITVGQFRRMSRDELLGLGSVGTVVADRLAERQRTWSDDDLISRCHLLPDAWECNWVGEFVPTPEG
jgi:hypothetical protein